MPRAGFAGSLTGPKVELLLDTGNPFLNHTIDGFLKIGTVAAAKTAAEETYDIVKRGGVSQHKLENSVRALNPFDLALRKMLNCRCGLVW